MDGSEAIRILEEKGFLLAPETVKLVLSSENPEELVNRITEKCSGKLFVTPEDLQEKEKTKIVQEEKKVVVRRPSSFRPLAREVEARVEKIRDAEVLSRGNVEDFVAYFRSRYEKTVKILRRRGSITKITDVRKRKERELRIAGLVYEKRRTKNGHLMITLEDDTGRANVLVPKSDNQLMALAEDLLLDTVVAVDVRKGNGSLLIAKSIIEPGVPKKDPASAGEEVMAAVISDPHVGSKLFMKKNFEKMIAWLNGDTDNEKYLRIAEKVKYVIITGDLVDGIGIYPGQEEELEYEDLFEQYKKFSEYILQIPEYVHVIIIPGNHDGVRTADPQPSIPPELVPELKGLGNVHFGTSPSWWNVHGIKTLLYHGTSFDDIVANVNTVTYNEPEKILRKVLMTRHLHPFYGGKPLIPTEDDPMTIDELPDMILTGHIHKNAYLNQNGVVSVNGGTWQQITPYQQKQGHKPTPCQLPVIDLNRMNIKVVRFDKGS